MTGLLFFLSALGAFNGLIISAYLLFLTKKKTLAKYLLAGLVLALSLRIGKSVLLSFTDGLSKIYLQLGLSACFFIGPFLYFYLEAVLEKLTKMPRKWAVTCIAAFVLIVGIGIIRPYETYPAFWNNTMIFIIYYEWLFFLILSGKTMKPIIQKGWTQASQLQSFEKWLLAIFAANLVIFICYFLVLYGFSAIYYLTGPMVFSFFLYLAIFGYFYTDKEEFSEQKTVKKYANKKIDSTEATMWLAQLEDLMKVKKRFMDPKLKLKIVAENLGMSTHLLSQLLNDNLGKNFTTYVNEYRIAEACTLLADNPQHLSLEGIGYEVGFSSKSNFFINFKKIKGMTPSQYQQQLLGE